MMIVNALRGLPLSEELDLTVGVGLDDVLGEGEDGSGGSHGETSEELDLKGPGGKRPKG